MLEQRLQVSLLLACLALPGLGLAWWFWCPASFPTYPFILTSNCSGSVSFTQSLTTWLCSNPAAWLLYTWSNSSLTWAVRKDRPNAPQKSIQKPDQKGQISLRLKNDFLVKCKMSPAHLVFNMYYVTDAGLSSALSPITLGC